MKSRSAFQFSNHARYKEGREGKLGRAHEGYEGKEEMYYEQEKKDARNSHTNKMKTTY
jgi:hypothetical protein